MLPLQQFAACIAQLSDVVEQSGSYPPGGQQTRPQRYQMTHSTQMELRRLVRHFGEALTACIVEADANRRVMDDASRILRKMQGSK